MPRVMGCLVNEEGKEGSAGPAYFGRVDAHDPSQNLPEKRLLVSPDILEIQGKGIVIAEGTSNFLCELLLAWFIVWHKELCP